MGYIIDIWNNKYVYTNNDTVYYWHNNNFYVLYNFHNPPNDSWNIIGNTSDCVDSISPITISSSGFLNINSNLLKYLIPYYNITESWLFEDTIIQKIGCLAYMFPKPTCIFDYAYEIGGHLRCYYDPNFGWYKSNNWTFSCDTLILANSEIVKNTNNIEINFDNVENTIIIKCSEDSNYNVLIYNTYGSLIKNIIFSSFLIIAVYNGLLC